MMASRGMGAISPSKMPSGKKTPRRDDTDFTQYKEGGEVWDTPNPAKNSISLTPAKKAKVKAKAKAAGRKYPNLIDNMRMARSK